jgi:hypothetical protein
MGYQNPAGKSTLTKVIRSFFRNTGVTTTIIDPERNEDEVIGDCAHLGRTDITPHAVHPHKRTQSGIPFLNRVS